MSSQTYIIDQVSKLAGQLSTDIKNPDIAAKRAMKRLGPDPKNWVIPAPGVDWDVFIIGGGQVGVTTAFRLRRIGISNVTVIDAADEGRAGVWLTKARMQTLRTPKAATGPELGISELSFRTWFETLHGEAAYAAIGRIARTDWAAYLKWFHRMIEVPVRYRTKLDRIEPAGGHFRLHLVVDGVEKVETARKVILANGVIGCGSRSIPVLITDHLPKRLYAHTDDEIDFTALKGKSIAILGAATSAFDAAAVALENGADEVHLFYHRPDLAGAVNKGSGGMAARAYAGIHDNYHLLPDADRWRLHFDQGRAGSGIPFDSVLRATKFANFFLHFSAPWNAVRESDGKVAIEAGDGSFLFDFAIAGTGYQYDPTTRPELRDFASEIALWRDRYQPPAELESEKLGLFPYLGHAYEFTEKVPGRAPYLRDIHSYNSSGRLSFGRPVGDVPGLISEIPRLVSAISRDLFFGNYSAYIQKLVTPPPPAPNAQPEFDRSKYEHAIWRAPQPADEVLSTPV